MAGYDPFGELFPGEPILDGVTTEGIFPLEAADSGELVGAVEATVLVAAAAAQTHTLNGTVDTVAVVAGGFIIGTGIVGVVEAAVEVDGSTLTVTADVFVGWGIPVGVA